MSTTNVLAQSNKIGYNERMIEIDYADIEDRVMAKNSTMAHICRKADMPQQSWIRWKTGVTQPNLGKLNTILAEVEKLEAGE
jgi:hypothetical protein